MSFTKEDCRKGAIARNKLRQGQKSSNYKSWPRMRLLIFEERGRVCERCGWAEQNPFHSIVPVQIDHINGDNKDNRRENLIVLCPNCHSLTEHYMFFGRKHKDFPQFRKVIEVHR